MHKELCTETSTQLPINGKDGLITNINAFRCVTLDKVLDMPLFAIILLTRENLWIRMLITVHWSPSMCPLTQALC